MTLARDMRPSVSKIFISYAREDIEVAKRLHRELSVRGYGTWVDFEDLAPGESWKERVRSAIHTCSHFVLLLSSNSVEKRGFVQSEVREAVSILDELPPDEVYLMPLRIDDCSPRQERLKDIQWVDLFPDFDIGLGALLRVLPRPKVEGLAMGARFLEGFLEGVPTYFVIKGTPAIVGRRSNCDIEIGNTTISGEHAILVEGDTSLEVCDLNSTNGTRLNGNPLVERRSLEEGDVIAFGGVELVYTKQPLVAHMLGGASTEPLSWARVLGQNDGVEGEIDEGIRNLAQALGHVEPESFVTVYRRRKLEDQDTVTVEIDSLTEHIDCAAGGSKKS